MTGKRNILRHAQAQTLLSLNTQRAPQSIFTSCLGDSQKTPFCLPSTRCVLVFLHLWVTQACMLPPAWSIVAPHKGGRAKGNEVSMTQEVTPYRLSDPTSLHLSTSRHNDKTVPVREGGGRGGGKERIAQGQQVLVDRSGEKVEQICNSVFHGDIWNSKTQPPPKAICVSVQGEICQSVAHWVSLQLGRTLILKAVCNAVASVNWV